LTVDGTVNARGNGDFGKGWVDGGLCVEDGETVINGSGTIRLQSKGCLLNIWSNKRHLTLDGVTLLGIADNNHPLVQVSEGGELVLKSGAITGNARTGEDWNGGGGVRIVDKGMFRMEGGTISGNSSVNSTERGGSGGGGVAAYKGTFIMKGGAISDNSARQGGGVRVAENSTFIMEGGTISGNTATSERNGYGGGVLAGWGSTFTLKSGTITGNSASQGGGGVRVVDVTTFTMEDGIISGNSAGFGGGVSQQEGTFTMKGGAISGNSAGEGGGVTFGDDCKFIMEGGTISGNSAGKGGGIFFRNNPNYKGYGASFTMKGGRIQGGTDSDGFTKNSGTNAAIGVRSSEMAKWGTGGTYTKGGVPQTGGGDNSNSDATLIAIPKK
jgi:hypothetical protein